VDGAGGVLAGRNINRASTGFGAGFNRILDCLLGVIGLVSRRPIILDIENLHALLSVQKWDEWLYA
jgi:hypothetical protein